MLNAHYNKCFYNECDFNFIMLIVLKQNVVLLSVILPIHARWNYDKNLFTWYDCALCFYSEFVYAECYYAEYRYVEGHYTVF